MFERLHPGEMVRDILDETGLTVTEAAARLGVARQTLTRLLSGRSGVSPEMALRLEAVFGSTASMWLRLQAAYELEQVRRERPELAQGLERVG